ncbi:MAG: tetratricopeptide repeat protein [Nitrospirae bacterium]|nr:MAG: tetratricopeptide repeat protein [Nitrospirota bacterium]
MERRYFNKREERHPSQRQAASHCHWTFGSEAQRGKGACRIINCGLCSAGALKADAKLAEANYTVGRSLDKMRNHEEATDAFKQAAALAPENPAITDSSILKKHLGM